MLRRAQIVDPASEVNTGRLFWAIVFGRGDTAAARTFVASLPTGVSPELRAGMTAMLARIARQFDAAAVALNQTENARPLDRPQQLIYLALDDVASGSLARARARADSAARLASAFLDRLGGAGVFGTAADFHTILGISRAIQGRAVDAVEEGQRAIVLNPAARDAAEGPRSVDGLIAIHLLLGHRDEAIRLITARARTPVTWASVLEITPASIRLDPLFDGIRDDPRIQALLKNDAAWVVR